MNKLASVFLLTSLGAFSSGSFGADDPKVAPPLVVVNTKSWAQVIKQSQRSIYCLEMSNDLTGETKVGTAFIMQPKPNAQQGQPDHSYLVTNLHMVLGAREGSAITPDGSRFSIDGMVDADIVNDIAILRTRYQPVESLKLGDSRVDALPVGEDVAVYGYPTWPEFKDGSFTSGIIAARPRQRHEVTNDIVSEFLMVTAAISDGSSGSPVFNHNGDVVGIINKQYTSPRTVKHKGGSFSYSESSSLGIAALSTSISVLMARINEAAEKNPRNAIVPLRYTRLGMNSEDLNAIRQQEFVDFYSAESTKNDGDMIRHGEALLKKCPYSPLVHLQLARAYLKSHETEKAIEELKSAIKDETYLDAWNRLGVVTHREYLRQDEEYRNKKSSKPADQNLLDLAFKSNLKAFQLLDVAATRCLLGDVLVSMGRFDEALIHLKNAYERNKDEPQIGTSLLYGLLKKGNFKEANELLPALRDAEAKMDEDSKERFRSCEKIISAKK